MYYFWIWSLFSSMNHLCVFYLSATRTLATLWHPLLYSCYFTSIHVIKVEAKLLVRNSLQRKLQLPSVKTTSKSLRRNNWTETHLIHTIHTLNHVDYAFSASSSDAVSNRLYINVEQSANLIHHSLRVCCIFLSSVGKDVNYHANSNACFNND